eukprot:COSAG01_NODE_44221_length_421_cov_1.018634_1_plen_26_part_10
MSIRADVERLMIACVPILKYMARWRA